MLYVSTPAFPVSDFVSLLVTHNQPASTTRQAPAIICRTLCAGCHITYGSCRQQGLGVEDAAVTLAG